MFLLIDGNSLMYRGYYASINSDEILSSEGKSLKAVCAFLNMLNKTLKLFEPQHCAVIFDEGKDTFRKTLITDYKKNRPETPEDLPYQVNVVKDCLNVYGIPYMSHPNYEADDIIGTIANRAKSDVIILTGDRDLLQLINEHTKVYIIKKGISDLQENDMQSIITNHQLKPHQIIEYKALAGDKSDNIKGVNGIGDVIARNLLAKYDNCENLYANINNIDGSIRTKLAEGLASCLKSKYLATIRKDVIIDFDKIDFRFRYDEKRVSDYLNKLCIKDKIWNL